MFEPLIHITLAWFLLSGCVLNSVKEVKIEDIKLSDNYTYAILGIRDEVEQKKYRASMSFQEYDIKKQKGKANCFRYNRIKAATHSKNITELKVFKVPDSAFASEYNFQYARQDNKVDGYIFKKGSISYIGTYTGRIDRNAMDRQRKEWGGRFDKLLTKYHRSFDLESLEGFLPEALKKRLTMPTPQSVEKPFAILCTP